ncbi:hypothetical protein BGZ83_009552 [Gryganskiella cystojenkinii]|nr:hypothetical protein BGZ83_009552 [Gryganskiella cystojenkinii]
MKLTTFITVIAVGAVASTSTFTEAAAAPAPTPTTPPATTSAACTAYLNTLADPTNALYKCRVYTALGFPGFTHANDHDTVKLQKALTSYCAQPACTVEQYSTVYKNIQTSCAADMTSANQAILGTTMYMWYMSPAQRDAVCFPDATKTNSCVVDSISEMISRAQLPDKNSNEDDLYGYLQYVTPFVNMDGLNATQFCTPCNQQVANIFANYYTKSPSTFPLNFSQNLTSATLLANILDMYKRNCGVTLGLPTSSGNNTTPGSFQPTNVTQSGGKNAAVSGASYSMGVMVAVVATLAGAMTLL